MQEHHIAVTRTARYFTMGSTSPDLQQVWFVCHGYSQLAQAFLELFRPLDEPGRLLVAPEGLSRYYTDHGTRAVGASWMTREDRLAEIDDYVRYLDQVRLQVMDSTDRASVKLVALGFSQGVATVCRWVARGDVDADRIILWGGEVPPDLDLSTEGEKLRSTDLVLVVGDSDEFATPKRVAAEEARLRDNDIPYRLVTFQGGHRLDKAVLRSLTGS